MGCVGDVIRFDSGLNNWRSEQPNSLYASGRLDNADFIEGP